MDDCDPLRCMRIQAEIVHQAEEIVWIRRVPIYQRLDQEVLFLISVLPSGVEFLFPQDQAGDPLGKPGIFLILYQKHKRI